MQMGVKVRIRNAHKLERLKQALENPGALLEKASEVGAETTLNLISKGFKRGTDPYGNPWDAPNNLQITGGIRRYAKRSASRRGWTVASTDQKAIWHHAPQPRENWGGKALPTRLQVPTSSRGWPMAWRRKISRAVNDALEALLRKAAR